MEDCDIDNAILKRVHDVSGIRAEWIPRECLPSNNDRDAVIRRLQILVEKGLLTRDPFDMIRITTKGMFELGTTI